MTDNQLQKLLDRGVEALERIAKALEKITDDSDDERGRSVRGFKVGGTD